MMFEIFGIWFLIILTYFIGYFTAQGRITVDEMKKVKKDIEKKLDTSFVGAVHRPSSQEIYKRSHPEKQAEEEAMIESLKKIPELNP